uniref:Putative secreted protein n=1 Tax=Anopheles triannulatus TaxID=58253 RepID=A0A2M4B2K8_9DIPT
MVAVLVNVWLLPRAPAKPPRPSCCCCCCCCWCCCCCMLPPPARLAHLARTISLNCCNCELSDIVGPFRKG